MRQTLVSGDVRAKEIAALVSEVKRRQLRLESLLSAPCRDGCTDCALCRKGYYENDCEKLLNDIADGNRSRWREWALLDSAVRNVRDTLHMRRRSLDPMAAIEDGNAARDLLEAITRLSRRPSRRREDQAALQSIAGALQNMGALFEKLLTGNDAYSGLLRSAKEDIIRHRRRVSGLEDIFWKQVEKYERMKCASSLTPAHFNRP